MSTGLVLQVVVTGVAAGAAYGLIGIGVALVYRLTGVVQLAQGELLGGVAFLALVLAAGRSPVTRTSVPVRLVVASAFLAVVVAAVAGAALYLALLCPFLRRGGVGRAGGPVDGMERADLQRNPRRGSVGAPAAE